MMYNILVLCDDLWHPAEVIERGIRLIESEEFCFDIVKTAKDILTPKFISQFDLILCCKSNTVNAANTAPWFEDTVTEVGPKEFEDYIRAGHGFIALHSGNVLEEGSPFSKLIGNYFNGHPLRCGVDFVMTANHPITKGVSDFSERDEHYQITVEAPDAVEFFRSRSTTGGEQIAGYVREIGDGRLCVITPGHTLAVWENAEFQHLLTNAIRWCANK